MSNTSGRASVVWVSQNLPIAEPAQSKPSDEVVELATLGGLDQVGVAFAGRGDQLGGVDRFAEYRAAVRGVTYLEQACRHRRRTEGRASRRRPRPELDLERWLAGRRLVATKLPLANALLARAYLDRQGVVLSGAVSPRTRESAGRDSPRRGVRQSDIPRAFESRRTAHSMWAFRGSRAWPGRA